jgi:hypothetical protein
MVGRVESFLPMIRLKHEKAFERIKDYLSSPPVLQVPKVGRIFKLYIAAQERVIGTVLTQEDQGKEFVVMYLSQRVLDVESRYTPIKKLCLVVYYTCTMSRYYLLSCPYIIVCQHDIIKCMLHKPVLSGRMGKWAYALVESDLWYEPLKVVKGQVLADFIMEHGIQVDVHDICLAKERCWQLFFDGSICSQG